jgi:hypothetical protein
MKGMRRSRPRAGAIAAWLGVIALCLDMLVPIHFAFGLATGVADARECGHYEGSAPPSHDAAWWALALLTGQQPGTDPSHSHAGFHPAAAVFCGATGVLAGFTPPIAAALPVPPQLENPRATIVVATNPAQTLPAGYRSRAPPQAAAELFR